MADIRINQNDYPGLYVSHSSLHVEAANGRHLVTLAGIVLLKDLQYGPALVDESTRPYFEGIPGGAPRQEVLYLAPNIPADLVPDKWWFEIEDCVPFITINAIFNGGHAVNAGWSVDTCAYDHSPQKPNLKLGGANASLGFAPSLGVPLKAAIGVKDQDGFLYRVGYNVTLIGTLTDKPPG